MRGTTPLHDSKLTHVNHHILSLGCMAAALRNARLVFITRGIAAERVESSWAAFEAALSSPPGANALDRTAL